MVMLDNDKLMAEDGAWALMYNPDDNAFAGYYFIRHNCPKWPREQKNSQYYLRHWYFWRHFHQPCSVCDELPPKKLQTLYVLASGDMEERHISSVEDPWVP